MELENTVKEALNALYHHPDDAVRSRADRWLQDFQRTIDAWQVTPRPSASTLVLVISGISCPFVNDPPALARILSRVVATRYSNSVQRDFEELPSEAFRPLRDSLYALLKKLDTGPPKVRTQICVAVAALAVHVSVEDWGDGGIVNWLSSEMKSHPEYMRSFLELLTVLPQEAHSYKIAARPERRRQFEKELISSAEVALSLLTACLGFDNFKEQVDDA
ncbi:hypothetical protein BHM03_00021348 [Ensete ventricosum]|nr:hypothetical protein BHM03_00021348 [Ensete ventricosum]